MSVHEFYHLKALITLEQENTTEWSDEDAIYFGDDRNDVPCKSRFWSLAMM